jgi:hypothetical protein
MFYNFDKYIKAYDGVDSLCDELAQLQLSLKDDPELQYNRDVLALYNFITAHHMALEAIRTALSDSVLGVIKYDKEGH